MKFRLLLARPTNNRSHSLLLHSASPKHRERRRPFHGMESQDPKDLPNPGTLTVNGHNHFQRGRIQTINSREAFTEHRPHARDAPLWSHSAPSARVGSYTSPTREGKGGTEEQVFHILKRPSRCGFSLHSHFRIAGSPNTFKNYARALRRHLTVSRLVKGLI